MPAILPYAGRATSHLAAGNHLAAGCAGRARSTIATKAGLVRTGPDQWHPVGRPEYLRQCAELSLRRLGLETIGLYQLHRIDPQVPAADQVGTLDELRKEGKIRYIGLSEVGMAELVEARLTARIASVQNRYNLISRQSEDVLDSPVMLPIPGTASVVHLEENIASAPVELTDEQFGALSTMS